MRGASPGSPHHGHRAPGDIDQTERRASDDLLRQGFPAFASHDDQVRAHPIGVAGDCLRNVLEALRFDQIEPDGRDSRGSFPGRRPPARPRRSPGRPTRPGERSPDRRRP